MKIKDYLVHDAQHFIPIENLPVIAPATRLDDALWLMGSRHANVAIIQNSPFELGLLPRNPAPAFGGAEVVGAGLVSGTPIQVVDDEEDLGAAQYTQLPSGIYAYQFGVVGVRRLDRLLGLISTSELGRQAFFAAPAVSYACAYGHIYYPPSPPSTCGIDGTPVR